MLYIIFVLVRSVHALVLGGSFKFAINIDVMHVLIWEFVIK